MIHLQNVTKQFDGRRVRSAALHTAAGGERTGAERRRAGVIALDGVDLRVERGELVSIVGPSGSGKSTLLNLVGGLDRPTAGVIKVDGQRLDALGDDELTRVRRDKIGFIFQFFNLLPSLSCFENISLPLHLRGWKRRDIERRTSELLGLVGLTTRRTHLPDELSGGERQRVAIARALAVFPPILLADEPTGNLDTRTGADILALVQDLHRRLGATVLIVTHDQTVAGSCARTITLRDGRIVSDERREPLQSQEHRSEVAASGTPPGGAERR